jgi:hypothetical protein
VSAVHERVAIERRWLTEVRLRATLRVLWCRELWSRTRYLGEDALAISHSDVDVALADGLAESEAAFAATDERAAAVAGELEALLGLGPDPRFGRLVHELGVTPGEQELLALALAAEVVPGLRRVYGYLQDDTVPLDASPAIAAALWGRDVPVRIGAHSALRRWALAQPVHEAPTAATGWIADPELLDELLGETAPVFAGPPPGQVLHARLVEEIASLAGAIADVPVEIELVGPHGSGRTTIAARVAAALGAPLVAADAHEVAAADDPSAASARVMRSARLAGALVAWRAADMLPDTVGAFARVTFLLVEEPQPARSGRTPVRASFTVPPIGRAERLQLWRARSDAPPPEPVASWALRPAEIDAAAQVAGAGDDAIRAVCRRLLLDVPRDLLSPLALPYTWDDLVVSPQLRAHLGELEAQARVRTAVLDDWGLARLTPLGRGVTALFAGPSGTGKTMAAQVLARSLGRELYRVDLAGVVNKYIGETEKHLRAVFSACERAPVVLFFDEADALFGRRMQVSDAHDRFANVEIDYLLQRMEQFDGVAILATNRKGDLDSAFLRRLRFAIDFAPPTVDERERLWRIALEDAVDRDGRPFVGDIDWRALARGLDLTGAGVKSAALAAASIACAEQAPVEMRHVLAAGRRELAKQGLVVRPRVTG